MSATATKSPPKKAEDKAKTLKVFRLNYGVHEQTEEGWTRPTYPEGHEKAGQPMYNDENGVPILPKSHLYKANEDGNNIIRSEIDLVKRLNNGDVTNPKFTYLSGDPSVDDRTQIANTFLIQENDAKSKRIAELEALLAGKTAEEAAAERVSNVAGKEGWSLKQLRDYCEEHEIEVSGCRTKEDFVSAIQLTEENRLDYDRKS